MCKCTRTMFYHWFSSWLLETKRLFLLHVPSLPPLLYLTNHNIVGRYVLLSLVLDDVLPIPKIKINKWNSLYFSQEAKTKTKNLTQDASLAWLETVFSFNNQEIRNIFPFYLNWITIKPMPIYNNSNGFISSVFPRYHIFKIWCFLHKIRVS